MKLSEIQERLGAQVLTEQVSLDQEAETAFASDLMSDVLAYSRNTSILITGLSNPQIIRTAEMLDVKCIILARGKQADRGMIELADESGVVLMSSEKFVFDVCSILSDIGLTGGGQHAK